VHEPARAPSEAAHAGSHFIEDPRSRTDPGFRESRFEIGDEQTAELRVLLCPHEEVVEALPDPRQLLRGGNQAHGGRRQRREKLCELLMVVSRHSNHLPTGRVSGAESSSADFNLSRHREIRLAIVPGGRSSASPIVR
jgi:hypothetical protein